MRIPSDEEQYKALIECQAYKLVENAFKGESIPVDSYERVFTVNKKGFLTWMEANYDIKTLPFVHGKAGKENGIYIIKKFKGYVFYEQENLVKFEEVILKTPKEVFARYITSALKHSGTGLPLEWWDR